MFLLPAAVPAAAAAAVAAATAAGTSYLLAADALIAAVDAADFQGCCSL